MRWTAATVDQRLVKAHCAFAWSYVHLALTICCCETGHQGTVRSPMLGNFRDALDAWIQIRQMLQFRGSQWEYGEHSNVGPRCRKIPSVR